MKKKQLKNSIYEDIFYEDIIDVKKINFIKNDTFKNSDYFNSLGEKESREIENLYIKQEINESIILSNSINKWKPIDINQLENEWDTESLDALFFSGYPKEAEHKAVQDIFFNKFNEFTTQKILTKDDIEQFSHQIYKGNTLEELSKNTAYMGKDINYISSIIKNGEAATPLLIEKNGNLEILGGRTRVSVSQLLDIPIVATIIDNDKMLNAFYEYNKENFLEEGIGFLALETREKREEILDCILNNKVNEISNDGEIWGTFNDEQKNRKIDYIIGHLGLESKIKIEDTCEIEEHFTISR